MSRTGGPKIIFRIRDFARAVALTPAWRADARERRKPIRRVTSRMNAEALTDVLANPALKQEINRSLVRGSSWMVAMRLGIRGIGLISTMILARLLTPADFGIVAMAM